MWSVQPILRQQDVVEAPVGGASGGVCASVCVYRGLNTHRRRKCIMRLSSGASQPIVDAALGLLMLISRCSSLTKEQAFAFI